MEGREAALPLVVVFSSALQLSLYKRVSPVAPAPHAFCPPSSGPLCSCSPVSAACVSATDQCKVLCHGSYRTIHWHSCVYLVNTQTHTHANTYACMHPHTHTHWKFILFFRSILPNLSSLFFQNGLVQYACFRHLHVKAMTATYQLDNNLLLYQTNLGRNHTVLDVLKQRESH